MLLLLRWSAHFGGEVDEGTLKTIMGHEVRFKYTTYVNKTLINITQTKKKNVKIVFFFKSRVSTARIH